MFNKAIIAGNLGRDPEIRYTAQGTAVCNFSVAASHGFGDKQKTEWFNVVAWSKTAEACSNYLSKGSPVLVEGHMETQSWEKDGQKRHKTELIAERVQFLGSKSEGQQSAPPPQETSDVEPF